MDVPLHKYWGDMSPCPIGIDAPALSLSLLSLLYWQCKSYSTSVRNLVANCKQLFFATAVDRRKCCQLPSTVLSFITLMRAHICLQHSATATRSVARFPRDIVGPFVVPSLDASPCLLFYFCTSHHVFTVLLSLDNVYQPSLNRSPRNLHTSLMWG